MPGNAVEVLLRQLRTFIAGPKAEGQSDRHLLEQFLAQRDEASFAALLERHGPMVLGVCRRVLYDEHLAEDAFQATFLILARNASTIPWEASPAWNRHDPEARSRRASALDSAAGVSLIAWPNSSAATSGAPCAAALAAARSTTGAIASSGISVDSARCRPHSSSSTTSAMRAWMRCRWTLDASA